MRPSLVTFVAVSFASAAHAGVTFEVLQPPVPGTAIAAQDFPNAPTYTCACFDDFTLAGRTTLETLRIFGFEEQGDASLNLDVRAWIYATPDLGATPLASLHGSQVDADLLFQLEGLVLESGTYWIAAQVVRPFVPGQQWRWSMSDTTNGAEAIFHNPGGAFGFGTSPIPISSVVPGGYDMAFRLEGVPAPGAAALFALAGLARRRRR